MRLSQRVHVLMAVDNGCCELLNDICRGCISLTTDTVIRLSQSNLLKLFIFYDAVYLLADAFSTSAFHQHRLG